MREYEVRGNTEEGNLVCAIVYASSKSEAMSLIREQMKNKLNLDLVAVSVDVFKGNVWQ